LNVEEVQGAGQVAGSGRRQQAGDRGQEAELGFHFLWGVPRSLESRSQELGGRW